MSTPPTVLAAIRGARERSAAAHAVHERAPRLTSRTRPQEDERQPRTTSGHGRGERPVSHHKRTTVRSSTGGIRLCTDGRRRSGTKTTAAHVLYIHRSHLQPTTLALVLICSWQAMAGTWLSVAAALAEGDAARRVVSLASAADTGDDEAAIGRGGDPRVSRATEAEGVTCARCAEDRRHGPGRGRGSTVAITTSQRTPPPSDQWPGASGRPLWPGRTRWPPGIAAVRLRVWCLVRPISAQSPRAKEHLGVCPRSRRSNGLPRHRSAVREHEACI